jgi:hypothetical protein
VGTTIIFNVCIYIIYLNGGMQAGHAEVGENLMQGKRMVSLGHAEVGENLMQGKRMVSLGRINVEPASRLLK